MSSNCRDCAPTDSLVSTRLDLLAIRAVPFSRTASTDAQFLFQSGIPHLDSIPIFSPLLPGRTLCAVCSYRPAHRESRPLYLYFYIIFLFLSIFFAIHRPESDLKSSSHFLCLLLGKLILVRIIPTPDHPVPSSALRILRGVCPTSGLAPSLSTPSRPFLFSLENSNARYCVKRYCSRRWRWRK